MTALAQQTADSALVERMKAGDDSALSALYDRYSAMLLGLFEMIAPS